MNTDRFKVRVWCNKEKCYLYNAEMNNAIVLTQLPDYKIAEQCTGLKDKNGKLIYENDIIKMGRYSMNWVIMVDSYGCRCICPRGNPILGCIEWSSFVKEYFFDEENTSVQIIGNIHENKELLDE